MERRLIDANDFLALYEDGNGKLNLSVCNIPISAVRQSIRDIPTIDAVEVVRCKDCRHCIMLSNTFQNEVVCGKRILTFFKPTDFCSYGEKRDAKMDLAD